MAVVEVPRRSGVSVKLNAGTDPSTGGTLIKSMALSGIKSGANSEKIMNVVNLAANVLAHPVERVEKTQVVTLENDA